MEGNSKPGLQVYVAVDWNVVVGAETWPLLVGGGAPQSTTLRQRENNHTGVNASELCVQLCNHCVIAIGIATVTEMNRYDADN